MAIGTDFEIQNDKDIRYIGAAHGVSGAGYHAVLAFHRWLQDLADDAGASGDDFMDITRDTPSDKAFDTIINLSNGYNIDDAAAEHLFKPAVTRSTTASRSLPLQAPSRKSSRTAQSSPTISGTASRSAQRTSA